MSDNDVIETIRLNLAELPRANRDACVKNCTLASSLVAGLSTGDLDALEAARIEALAECDAVVGEMKAALLGLGAAIAGAR